MAVDEDDIDDRQDERRTAPRRLPRSATAPDPGSPAPRAPSPRRPRRAWPGRGPRRRGGCGTPSEERRRRPRVNPASVSTMTLLIMTSTKREHGARQRTDECLEVAPRDLRLRRRWRRGWLRDLEADRRAVGPLVVGSIGRHRVEPEGVRPGVGVRRHGDPDVERLGTARRKESLAFAFDLEPAGRRRLERRHRRPDPAPNGRAGC